MKGNHLTAAAIVGQDGTVWAQSSYFPSFDNGEITAIVEELDQPGRIDILIGGKQYTLIEGIDNEVIRGERGSGGVTIKRTREALVIGIYEEPVTHDMCNALVETLGDYIANTLGM
ncbi:profilin-1-like [Rosa rugosa]|uniref:profilin-1-like n=1 Tax=Rosa rugosa TaxID=74645 RepID=UPI002B40A48B|nr:profilin-1-like [Rosa rugosa]